MVVFYSSSCSIRIFGLNNSSKRIVSIDRFQSRFTADSWSDDFKNASIIVIICFLNDVLRSICRFHFRFNDAPQTIHIFPRIKVPIVISDSFFDGDLDVFGHGFANEIRIRNRRESGCVVGPDDLSQAPETIVFHERFKSVRIRHFLNFTENQIKIKKRCLIKRIRCRDRINTTEIVIIFRCCNVSFSIFLLNQISVRIVIKLLDNILSGIVPSDKFCH
ncbi:hypothetical protein MsAm2_00020 [Methanolapillus ohkumae]|uniref:Uncharacterized protein n=1 Tax=Methanolapillus ohkumae TaxID=3028298 RepID=A0AA96ZWR8_9EURY|nr:hypothetical protein MsAm2_00020 [Methanosarcinaceae archaeon Am2]